MEKRIFGTDGIRGVYGDALTEQTAYALGYALGQKGSVLIGRDNRLSSPLLARALACGVERSGGSFRSVGLITTPALYCLLTRTAYAHAVMVTASHNPPDHNGLKVFTQKGKPDDRERKEIENAIRGAVGTPDPHFPYREEEELKTLYEEFIRKSVGDLGGMTAVVDFAEGAGVAFKGLLGTLGVHVIPLHAGGDGARINEGSGALHPERCIEETKKLRADLGFALDGDGDRILAVDGAGRVLDGDYVTYLLACRKKAHGTLAHNAVAMTVMTNGGVIKSLSDQGIAVRSCAVGDTAVAEVMRRENLSLGGEQSGHVILGDNLMTGDGLLVGATLLKSIREDGPLSMTPPPKLYPQALLNLPVPDKSVVYAPALQAAIEEVKASMGEGRVLVRASGTEQVVRIMAEHPDRERAEQAALRLKEALCALLRQ